MVEENPIAELTNHETNQTDHAQIPGATSPQSYPTPFRNKIEQYPKRSQSMPVQRCSGGLTTSVSSPYSPDSLRTTEMGKFASLN